MFIFCRLKINHNIMSLYLIPASSQTTRIKNIPVMGGVSTPFSGILQPRGHGVDQILPTLVVLHLQHTKLGKSLAAAPEDLFADNF
jgi:hypothetical protein